MNSADQPLLKLENITKRYKELTAVNGVDLEVSPGEKLVIIGPSGSGKSTLLRSINLLEVIDTGSIRFEGREVFDAIHTLADEGMTMIIVTHHMGFARELADRVIFMDGGNFLAQGTPEELFSKGQDNERIRSFLNSLL
jgi:ABC-type polar amino acid transport system ATPase subunit